jgi:hypothetical protein
MFIINICVFFQLVYVGLALFKWTDLVKSQSGLGITGVLLVTITVAGGLGCCAIIGLTFNASTTQILPFLSLGLGVNAMFLLTHTYSDICGSDIPHEVRFSYSLNSKVSSLKASPVKASPLKASPLEASPLEVRSHKRGLFSKVSKRVLKCVVHLQDKVTPSTKALWPGASFQNRFY